MGAPKQCFVCTLIGGSGEARWGSSEPVDRLCFVFVFVLCVACASGRGEAASAREVQSVPPHAGLCGGKSCYSSRPPDEARDVVCAWVLQQNGIKSDLRRAHCE